MLLVNTRMPVEIMQMTGFPGVIIILLVMIKLYSAGTHQGRWMIRCKRSKRTSAVSTLNGPPKRDVIKINTDGLIY